MKKSQVLDSSESYDIVIPVDETGSFVYPEVAVAKELKRQFPSLSILFLRPPQGVGFRIVHQEGFPAHPFPVAEGRSQQKLRYLNVFYHVSVGVYHVRQLLKKFQPRLVLGASTRLTASTLYAAYLLHIPTLILEVNYRPGFATQLLSKSVDRIALGFQETASAFSRPNVIYTGTPVRKEFYLIGKTSPPDKGEKQNILIISGSHGNHAINQAAIDALPYLLPQRNQFIFTHQSGSADYAYVKQNYDREGFRAEVLEYIDDMPKMYAKAHLVICQGGGSTIAELHASRRPAIIIPAIAAQKQQTYNALGIQELGIAKIIPEPELSGETLAEALQNIGNHPESVSQIWTNDLEFGQKTATERVVEICLQLTRSTIGRSLEDSYDRT
ncbi:UDP-N-acetylglucosamine--N-acetylmuramyl-(pentapeptide) pyrophosphoryl-undecaprenol N-acetylglucosamine transferase [Candidatus Vecturithrix granuli]|uniref:UDP-N-acetylglucosamine--N-acetylmuramyl-(pentapeptide) pyrophosphoryl-undecaprenol N-acetylglucosamine transferase n=1 Tax=Vecturithrix granuli TaxID=1499967 RepID=A0A081C853_VECG1|nr:UDP-N-acetylglucosamine--N-acetylmuramyl-(pentapeptide) pyrophosphoryl-undecaprenol N-acetylglucosamine transferase [Candidatus Vecturithrix granuli]